MLLAPFELTFINYSRVIVGNTSFKLQIKIAFFCSLVSVFEYLIIIYYYYGKKWIFTSITCAKYIGSPIALFQTGW